MKRCPSTPSRAIRPTLMLMPPPASRSRRGCGRSGSSRTRMGRAGALGRRSSCGTPVKDANASRSSAGSAVRSSFTRTAAMCPSTTFTRWHCALTANLAGVTRPASRETRKILGSLEARRVTPARFAVSAQCHRVNVVDGHMAAVRVKLDRAAEPAELREAFASFTGVPQELRLPSAPERPILVRDEPDRPQPRLDRDAGGGMSISVGRIARDGVLGHRFIALSHNTIRGAAGAAILNAELLLAKGYLEAP